MELDTKYNLKEVCTSVLNLTKEENKVEFLKNYNTYKIILDQIEQTINTTVEFDENISMNELFTKLAEFEKKVQENNISIEEFKILKNLTELIDKKLQSEKIEIVEVK